MTSTDRDAVQVARRLASRNPALANAHLIDLAIDLALRLPRGDPAEDLSRCVGLQVFHTHHLSDEAKAEFPKLDAFRAHLEAESDPVAYLHRELKRSNPVFPAKNSWLVPASDIVGLTGAETVAALEIDVVPPLIVFNLPLSQMRAAGVTVRPPHPVDSVPHGLTRFNPVGGLKSGKAEYVDGNVPVSAIGSLEWRP